MAKVFLNLSEIEAIIFDMNGTIINDMNYHLDSWIKFCLKYGISLTEEEFRIQYSGRKNAEMLPALFNKKLSQEEINGFSEEKEAIYRLIYGSKIKEINGFMDFLNIVKSKKIKTAIATTAYKKNREFIFNKLNLNKAFDLVMGEEDVSKGKPNPEIYIKTAKVLKVDYSKCLVFEDSPPGVLSAKHAGMKVVGVLTTHTKEDLKDADYWINDYTDIQIN